MNRGIILDAVVLIVNTLLMTVLAGRLAAILDARKEKETFAMAATFIYLAAFCILPGVAALFKFFAGNRFRPAEYQDAAKGSFPTLLKIILGGQFILGGMFIFAMFETREDLLAVLGPNSLLSNATLTIAVTAMIFLVVYPVFTYCHFFMDTTGRTPSRARFISEVFADICIFTNVILFQAFWGLLMNDLPGDMHSIPGRLFQFLFAGVLIYIPPRIFYLADDGGRWTTWVMILLANLPVLVRIFFV